MYEAKNDYRAYCEMVADASSLEHHGIKGQKHGVRNYQNEDGSHTPARPNIWLQLE